MIAYIRDIARRIPDILSKNQDSPTMVRAEIAALVDELPKLETRDFLPSVRAEFALFRAELIYNWEEYKIDLFTPRKLRDISASVERFLNAYGGEGSHAESREFGYVKEPDLRRLIERDYKELSLILFPSGAWKSSIVMAGSILEAILCALLSVSWTHLSIPKWGKFMLIPPFTLSF